MTRRTAFSLKSTFSDATATLQQQQELKRLRAEIEKLRTEKSQQRETALATVREELKNYSGEQLIPLEAMRPSRQARQTITKSALYKRAESLKKQGQLNPIILVPVIGSERIFEIEDGELRWRAAQHLLEQGYRDWNALKAVIAPPPLDAAELHKRSLIHHLHREDLNPLDRIEAIISQICSTVDLNLSPAEIKESGGDKRQAAELKLRKIIRNLDYRLKKNPPERAKLLQLLEVSCEEQRLSLEEFELNHEQLQILSVLLELQLNVCSLAANDLPMLTLPTDLKRAIRTSELPCRQALVLAKLSGEKLGYSETEAVQLRQQIAEQVVAEALSLKNTRKLVEQILCERGANQDLRSRKTKLAEVEAVLSRMSLKELKEGELKSLRGTLVEKLHEIEQLLSNSTP